MILYLYSLQDHLGRDLKDPRLDMILEAESTARYSEELWVAAEEENLEEVKRLVNMGHNPMSKYLDDSTTLHVAAYHGKIEILKYLVEDLGCNPASPGPHGGTPLHISAERKHLSIVQYLITKHEVDSLLPDDEGYSSLHRACVGGDLDIVKFIMNSILTYMKMEDIFNDVTKYKATPIHVAAVRGNLDIVNYYIVDLKCDPNLLSEGRGPIFDAAQGGHLSIVKSLIEEHGCDPASTTLRCRDGTSTNSGLLDTKNEM